MAANWLREITNIASVMIESLYSSYFLQIVATPIPDSIEQSLWLQSGGESGRPSRYPELPRRANAILPTLATLWAYLTQKHRDNAGPELLNNPAVIEAARDG
jgi:hypothetical protein